jgi:peptidyl-prolyl cis-trans isomerase C
MKNKKLIITTTSIIVIIIASFATYKFISSKGSTQKDIVARYEGGVVTLNQAQTELNKLSLQNPNLKGIVFSNLTSDQKEAIIKEIILKEFAYREAKKQKLHKTEDYKQALKLFETEMLKQKLFVKLTNDAKEEANLKENYDKLVKDLDGKQDLKISYIALKNENDAKYVHNILLKYPSSFARQAKLKSIDKETAKNGGDLDFVLEDVLPVEIVNQVKELEKGQISKPFSLTDKWIIIKFEDSRPAKIATFEDAKENLARSLSQKALQDFISGSLEKANISMVVK